MWITKLLVEKLDKKDKEVEKEISEGTISDKDVIIKGGLIGFLGGMIDGCLIIGAIQVVKGTIRLITKK